VTEKASSRLKLFAVLVAMMFAALTARLWYLQVLAAQSFLDIANNSSLKFIPVDARRGEILDSKGNPLVGNRRSFEITVQQQLLEQAPNPEAVLSNLADHLHVPVGDITKAIQDPQYYDYQPIPVAVDVSQDDIFYIAEHHDEFPGVGWTQASVRDYPDGPLAAHVLGTVGLITKQQINSGHFDDYGTNDIVGRTGLEQSYERFLHGVPGVNKILVDPAGKQLPHGDLGSVRRPMPGDDVQLYLDSHLQRQVEEDLVQGLQRARQLPDDDTSNTATNFVANAGAVVVMDPETSGVQAIASWPSYDPSWFVKGLTPRQSARLLPDPRKPPDVVHAPLVDRAVQAAYAPGSTFKPFVALAALKEGVTTLTGTTHCPAQYAYPSDPTHPFNNWSAFDYGYLNIQEALQYSCDTVFYQFGAAVYDRWRANPIGTNSEPFQRDLRGFGFDHAPGIDLPSQASGSIPVAADKLSHPNAYPDGWLPADDILMSIGQGAVTTSPLQMADAYSAIANGGQLCEPRLAERIQAPDGKLVKKVGTDCKKLPYSQQELATIYDGLTRVVSPTGPHGGGTGASAFAGFPFSKVAVAGKTGTAQRPGFDQGQDTSWFAAIVGPREHPDHVIVVMVEQGGHGSTTAAPIARSIIEDMYGLHNAGAVNGGSMD
jgi:penicillin-binding protein 2